MQNVYHPSQPATQGNMLQKFKIGCNVRWVHKVLCQRRITFAVIFNTLIHWPHVGTYCFMLQKDNKNT